MSVLTLGIETSCDETSVAVVEDGSVIRSNIIYSQLDHSKYGGVVPEIAGRAHLKKIVPVYSQALAEAEVSLDSIDLIAATMGPGLVGALLIGLTFGKGLAFAVGKPFVGVNHMEGHIAANLLLYPTLDQHHLTLIVSGGHTMLVEVEKFGKYKVLGRTIDDAAGEAFDKVAKLLDLGYPGGAHLNKLADDGDPDYVKFPRPMLKDGDHRFSFSGLKTAVAVFLKKLSADEYQRHRADIAASFQEAVVDVLVSKTIKAARERYITDVSLSGGVAANTRLRHVLQDRLSCENKRLFFPTAELCTDNAAMIAAAGYYMFQQEGPGEFVVDAIPYLRFE